ncbi:PREDICTED: AT-hook motif nuclear-localized protein 5 [Tarenaya hassleriana]|uniref:AT-hook motif nuclear-localized protein 5 n=1 Tax=Tarenaya hassleriana TaxID=28532 RepID=UPI00053C33F1|nr:PREDICTED: AT-hook motif nuclear-localized protein 5 [Tarenaya hassleriana]
MDGRGAMAFPDAHSSFYHLQRGAFSAISASQATNALHAPPGMRPMSNPNIPPQSNAGPPFSIGEHRHQDFGHGFHMGMASSAATLPPTPATEPVVKKKRGRPRKYAPDGQVSLGLSSLSLPNKPKSSSMSDPNAPKRARGRPPGTGRKQRLANLGEWMNSSAGLAFAPHVISVGVGEDIISKILSFSMQRPRAVCIMSATGTVSSVTLHQPASSVPSLSFEGRFEIICLSGSYLVNEEGGPRSRTGGISVSLSSPEGRVIGGGVGMLIAASLVQVVACSFVYGSSKANKASKQENGPEEENGNDIGTPAGSSAPQPSAQTPNFSAPPTMAGWSGSTARSLDSRNLHLTDIDLTRG